MTETEIPVWPAPLSEETLAEVAGGHWFIGREGQRVDIVHNAGTCAANTGLAQVVHSHAYLTQFGCQGVRDWGGQDVPHGTCWLMQPDPALHRALGSRNIRTDHTAMGA